jgi:hypothetical protein
MRAGARLVSMMTLVVVTASCDAASDEEQQSKDPISTPPTSDDERPVGDQKAEGVGTTWSALYRDLFGPAATASCAGNGMCHGSAAESGTQASHGYVCATREGCRTSMLSIETALVQSSDADAPEKSTLVQVLRRRNASGKTVGTMPKRSGYVFSEDAIDRIETWIRNGAPDD